MRAAISNFAVAMAVVAATPLVAAQSTSWQIIGNTTLACVHAAYTAADRLFCMERPHVYPYVWNPYASGNAANIIYEGQESILTGPSVVSTNVDVPYVPFCSGHAMGPNGQVVVVGGDQPYVPGHNVDGRNAVRSYFPCTSIPGNRTCGIGKFVVNTPMAQGNQRWYPTVATLADGRQIIVGGSISNQADIVADNNPTYEYANPNKTTGVWPRPLQLLIDAFPAMLFPLVYQLPSGNIFIFANVMAVLLDPRTETVTKLPPLPNGLIDHGPWSYPFTATAVVLPLRPGNNYTATIQICGGPKASLVDADGLPYASPVCMQITPESPFGPVWSRVDDMPSGGRIMPDVVILPDGGLLYTNGCGVGLAGGDAGTGRCYNPVFQTEIMYHDRPAGQQWIANLAKSTVPRLYHSEALLRYDGHVITSGSDQQNFVDKWGLNGTGPRLANCWPMGTTVCTDPFEYRIEQFTPPYLTTTAVRPVILGAPAVITHGQSFAITTGTAATDVTTVVIIRHASTTHSTNTDQRLIELVVTSRNATNLVVSAPPNSRIGVPGTYMLFLLKGAIPSVSAVLTLTNSATSNPVNTCTSMYIDTMYQWGLNNLGLTGSEDGTTLNHAVSNGRTSFVPQAGSYFYENLSDTCLDVSSYRYLLMTLNVASGIASVQFQFQFGCSAATVIRQTIPAFSFSTGGDQVVAIDLSAYATPAALKQLRAFSMSNFLPLNGPAWSIGNIQLVADLNGCGFSSVANVIPAPTTTTPTPTATATSAPSATTTGVTAAGCAQTTIDSFARTGANSLGLGASDDATTTGYAVLGGVLSFLPKADGSSYVYENLNCLAVATNRFIVFTLQSASSVQFVVQLQSGCGATGTRVNGPAIIGSFAQATTFAIDTQSYMSPSGSASVWSFVLTQMSTLSGTDHWRFSDLATINLLPCAYKNVTYVSRTQVTPNWTNTTTIATPSNCKRVSVDSFKTYGQNDLGVLASDDRTMASYTIANGQVTMVPKADLSSYMYEDINVGGVPYDATLVPFLMFTIQTSAAGASFSVNAEVTSTRVTLATLSPGATSKTYVIPLASYLTPAQLQGIAAFGWNTFKTDGTTAWTMTGVALVNNYTACTTAVVTVVSPPTTNTAVSVPPTSVTTSPAGCSRTLVDSFMRYGQNDLGVLASDDRTMTSYVVANGVATMVPKKDLSSYFYEDLLIGGVPFNASAVNNLVFTIQTSSLGAAVTVNAEVPTAAGSTTLTRITLAVLNPGATARTYVIPLKGYLSAAQLQAITSFGWNTFVTDGASTWNFTGLQMVSNPAVCNVLNATVVAASVTASASATSTAVATPTAAAGCKKVTVDSFSRYGQNDLAAVAADDATMTTFSVGNQAATMIPKKDQSSYFYENLSTGNLAFNATSVPYLVVTVASAATNAAVTVAAQVPLAVGSTSFTRVTLATLTLGTTLAAGKTFVISLSSFLTPSQLQAISSISFASFVTDGTSSWTFTNLGLVNNASTCLIPSPTMIPVSATASSTALPTGCKAVSVDTFARYGQNDLGILASDDRTMASYVVANNYVTMVPKADLSSYWYEDINVGGLPYNVSAVPYLVFTVQTGAVGGSFAVSIEVNAPVFTRITLATLTPGILGPKTYAIYLPAYLTTAQIQTAVAFGWAAFKSDGTSPWTFRGVQLINDVTKCQIPGATAVTTGTA
ncbi:hypothetical protein HDU87_008793 [Geranomyces variabilis]|uniref:Uncharacterized protein n=1 Tax=Geranomyces variabilis TaxID=109894 RepID=A0AAD5XJL5_9FUNG|nr:hypothetical protein HDU87_008793 [Geranomyces variabilis]